MWNYFKKQGRLWLGYLKKHGPPIWAGFEKRVHLFWRCLRDRLPLFGEFLKKRFWLLVAGFSIGTMLGLSETPIIGDVLPKIVAVAATVVAVLSGVSFGESKYLRQVDTVPIGVLTLGMLLGALAGIHTRNIDLLSVPGSSRYGTGLLSEAKVKDSVHKTCSKILAIHDNRILEQELNQSGITVLEYIARSGEPEEIRQEVEEWCSEYL